MIPLARGALWAGLVLAAQDPPTFRAGEGGGFAFDTAAQAAELYTDYARAGK